jgi:hypothetical protein
MAWYGVQSWLPMYGVVWRAKLVAYALGAKLVAHVWRAKLLAHALGAKLFTKLFAAIYLYFGLIPATLGHSPACGRSPFSPQLGSSLLVPRADPPSGTSASDIAPSAMPD